MWRFLDNFFAGMSGRQRLFALVFPFSLLIIRFTKGSNAALVTFALVVTLLITRRIWLPEGYGKTMVRQISLGIVVATAWSFSLWNHFVESVIAPAVFQRLQQTFPSLAEYHPPSEALSYAILVFVLIGIFLVNYFMRDKTAMGTHQTPLEKEFPEKTFKQRLEGFCRVLSDDLQSIDLGTDWDEENFIPLDAEVEMQSGKKRSKKVADLLTTIKSDRKSDVFLILGDPGSGKSVALRKLCQDLLKEVDKTGKVPLYINLREWQSDEPWTEDHPPTFKHLYDFVLKNLKERGEDDGFLDDCFKPMLTNGRFFIVLDSFDEIPAVLDADSSSWLIDALSDVIYKFWSGANESRGVLASRIFRKPTHKFQAQTTLEIRPFTDLKIKEIFEKNLINDPLFKNRLELVPIARTPFTAGLLINYAKEHDNRLPETQAEMYADYISRCLKKCSTEIKKQNLSIGRILQRAEDIANFMITTPEYGLDVPIEALELKFGEGFITEEISILTFARLGRGRSDRSSKKRFSFVHRRFQEYFITQRLLKVSEELRLEAIPTDSRWRDALVLYCEVTDEEQAKKIAEFCWQEINKIAANDLPTNDPRYLRGIHSLRFLKDAFRARLKSLSSFRNELTNFIEDQIEAGVTFKITFSTIQRLGSKVGAGEAPLIPDKSVLYHLMRLINQEFISEKTFIDNIEKRIGAQKTNSYRDVILRYADKNYELLKMKLAVEATGLLKSRQLKSIIKRSLEWENWWIHETALRSCRHLPRRLSRDLEYKFRDYLKWLSDKSFFHHRRELLFSLSLVDGFSSLHKFGKARVANLYLKFLGILFISIFILLLPSTLSLFLILLLLVGEHLRRKIGAYWGVRDLRKEGRRTNADYELFKAFVASFGVLGYLSVVIFTNRLLYIPNVIFETVKITLASSLVCNFFRIETSLLVSYLFLFLFFGGIIFQYPWYSFYMLPHKPPVKKIEWSKIPTRIMHSGYGIKWSEGFSFVIGLLLVWYLSSSPLNQSIVNFLKLMEAFFEEWSKGEMFILIRNIILAFLLIIFAGTSIYMVQSIGEVLFAFFRDSKFLKNISRLSKIDRSTIFYQFNQFETSWGRKKYVQLLQQQNSIVEGEWPDGKLPNIGNDEASTLLAQLEERWLGLAR
ncbi:MAG: NACHT domain-containing protein [bacterium]|nr:NACHT domain-containing protein [bacterium]